MRRRARRLLILDLDEHPQAALTETRPSQYVRVVDGGEPGLDSAPAAAPRPGGGEAPRGPPPGPPPPLDTSLKDPGQPRRTPRRAGPARQSRPPPPPHRGTRPSM